MLLHVFPILVIAFFFFFSSSSSSSFGYLNYDIYHLYARLASISVFSSTAIVFISNSFKTRGPNMELPVNLFKLSAEFVKVIETL